MVQKNPDLGKQVLNTHKDIINMGYSISYNISRMNTKKDPSDNAVYKDGDTGEYSIDPDTIYYDTLEQICQLKVTWWIMNPYMVE